MATVTTRVYYRDSFLQFSAACRAAATASVKAAIEMGADISRGLAPVRTGQLASTIQVRMISATEGEWFADAPHALHVEFGTRAHDQPGNVSFFWEEQGRMWEPGTNTISHPGTSAQPYLRPAKEAVEGALMVILKANYPG